MAKPIHYRGYRLDFVQRQQTDVYGGAVLGYSEAFWIARRPGEEEPEHRARHLNDVKRLIDREGDAE